MPDDRVTTSWRHAAALRQPRSGAGALGELPAAAAAMLHADSMNLEVAAASAPSSSPAHAPTAAAGCRTDRQAEAIRQAAPLATWEDEGGKTASVA